MSMHADSASARLAALSVGGRTYVETDLANWPKHMTRWLVPRSRRPVELANREFKAKLFTAVPASDVGDVRYLICIERAA